MRTTLKYMISNLIMSYKDIKVTVNGGFYVESKDLFKKKKEVLENLKRLQTLINKMKTNY